MNLLNSSLSQVFFDGVGCRCSSTLLKIISSFGCPFGRSAFGFTSNKKPKLPFLSKQPKCHHILFIFNKPRHNTNIQFGFSTQEKGNRSLSGRIFYFQTIHKKPIPHVVDAGWLREDSLWMELSDALQGHDAAPVFNDLLGPCKAVSYQRMWLCQKSQERTFGSQNGLCCRSSKINATRQTALFEHLFTEMFGNATYKDSDLIIYCLHSTCHQDEIKMTVLSN